MADPLSIELHASGEEDDDGSGDAVDTDDRGLRSAVRLHLTVTAIVGTLSVTVESSPDGSSGWRQVGAFDDVTAVGRQRWAFDECDRYVRVSWELAPPEGNTPPDPEATFVVAGEAHVLYGDREDLGNEINAVAIAGIDARIIARCRIKASCDAEAALASGYKMPLTVWPESIGQREASIAVFLAMKNRGFKPGATIDDLIVKAHDDAQKWLKDVGAGRLKPPGMTPTDNLGVHTSSGNPRTPSRYVPRLSDNWGDF